MTNLVPQHDFANSKEYPIRCLSLDEYTLIFSELRYPDFSSDITLFHQQLTKDLEEIQRLFIKTEPFASRPILLGSLMFHPETHAGLVCLHIQSIFEVNRVKLSERKFSVKIELVSEIKHSGEFKTYFCCDVLDRAVESAWRPATSRFLPRLTPFFTKEKIANNIDHYVNILSSYRFPIEFERLIPLFDLENGEYQTPLSLVELFSTEKIIDHYLMYYDITIVPHISEQYRMFIEKINQPVIVSQIEIEERISFYREKLKEILVSKFSEIDSLNKEYGENTVQYMLCLLINVPDPSKLHKDPFFEFEFINVCLLNEKEPPTVTVIPNTSYNLTRPNVSFLIPRSNKVLQ